MSSRNDDENKNNNNYSGSSRSNIVRSFKVMDILRGANELQEKLNRDYATKTGTSANASDGPEKVLHLEVGQPESGAPHTVASAAVEALTMPRAKDNVMGYTDAFGLLELRRKIRQHYIDKYGDSGDDNDESNSNTTLQIPDISQIVVTTGSSGAFLLAFTACFDPNDTVAIASSGYPCYRNILQALGCSIATVGINDEYKITATELEKEIQARKQSNAPLIKGLILSSPSNPTGSMLTPKELKELCELCNRENIVFMSDEIYHGISYGNVKEATALQYAAAGNNNNANENIVVINSFSKYYSMPGWRLGWMVIPQRFVQSINKLQQNMFINAPTVSQTAALKCWDSDTIAELETHVTKYKANRTAILDRFDTETGAETKSEDTTSVLKGLMLETNVAPADGGFYVYVDLGEEFVCMDDENENVVLDSVKLCELLLGKEYVALTPGIDFEDPECPQNLGRRRFRISYAGGTENITKAMDKFVRFWNEVWLPSIASAKSNNKNV
jgi:aspartate/methionine/tyrosine aminotransferase